MRKFLFVLLAALATAPAGAEPSFDCTKAGSSVEELICADGELAGMDVRMAERYADALGAAAQGADADEATKMLRATQRGWIKGRDECWKADDMRACVASEYTVRDAELVALWMLEPASAVVSYVCEGNPANEVTAYFFDAASRAVRLEYGDSIRAGWAVPAASGAKYETAFGGMFWLKGREAILRWAAETEMTCVASG